MSVLQIRACTNRFCKKIASALNTPTLPTNYWWNDRTSRVGSRRTPDRFLVVQGFNHAKGSTMKKLMIIGLIGAVALVAIAKKTNVFSYASTFANHVSAETQKQI